MSTELVLALLIMFIGLAGCIIPLIPGPSLIWLGALFYAWTGDFKQVGWVTLLILFAIMLAATTSEVWVGALRNKRAGVSLAGTLLSAALGIAGLFVLGLPGMLLGSIVGAVLPDFTRYRDWRRLLKLSVTTIGSWLISAVVQLGLGLVMIGIFLANAL